MTFQTAVRQILSELESTLTQISPGEVDTLISAILDARRVYLTGQGRTGLMARAWAMRLMHLGLTAFVVGETTTPAIGSGDLMIAISKFGTTTTTVHQAQRAHAAGARIAAVSTSRETPLASVAHMLLCIPADETVGVASLQFGGSLFEQATLLVADCIAVLLKKKLQISDDAMHARHVNLE